MGNYLSSNKEESYNKIIYAPSLTMEDVCLQKGIIQGIDQYLDLATTLNQFKMAEETNQEKKEAYRKQAEQIFQAEIEGKAGSQ